MIVYVKRLEMLDLQLVLLLATATFAVNYSKLCDPKRNGKFQFSKLQQFQRSQQKVIDLENTFSLEECLKVARAKHGLAVNYGLHQRENSIQRSNPINRTGKNRHFWLQPEEFFNCHILDCPENNTFRSMTNDSRFDYYSLYAFPPTSENYTCVPEVGLFVLHLTPQNYANASRICRNVTYPSGSLAYVGSSARTTGLSKLLREHNEVNSKELQSIYVGMHFNRKTMQPHEFRSDLNETLNCSLYRAWAPGHPIRSGSFVNASCVALTVENSWITVKCEQKLPFVCEIHTTTYY